MTRPIGPIVAVLLVLAASTASAQLGPLPPGPPPPRGPGQVPLDFVLDAVDLTPQQQAQVLPQLRARHGALRSSRLPAQSASRALMEQIQSATFDEAAIRAKAAAVAAFEADRAVADAALLRDVRAVLTSEQRAKFDRLMGPSLAPPSAVGDGL